MHPFPCDITHCGYRPHFFQGLLNRSRVCQQGRDGGYWSTSRYVCYRTARGSIFRHAFPGAGALALVWLISMYAIISGFLLLMLAGRARNWKNSGGNRTRFRLATSPTGQVINRRINARAVALRLRWSPSGSLGTVCNNWELKSMPD